MLKLKASFSKKDFNGNLYSSAIEIELPDGLSGEQIIGKDHEAFNLLRQAIDEEINSNQPTAVSQQNHVNYPQQAYGKPPIPQQQTSTATSKQLKLLFDLGTRSGIRINDIVRNRFNVNNANLLTKEQCALMIDEIKSNSCAA